MPGSSLWLVPPPDSDLYNAISLLITSSLPSTFPSTRPPKFAPHITLTSDITLEDASDSQKWLDGLSLSLPSGMRVAIREVEVGEVFFKKVTMRVEKDDALLKLAALCRAAGVQGADDGGAKTWARDNYLPHCSLMYSELPKQEVEAKLDEIQSKVQKVRDRTVTQESGKGSSFTGGSIWLVPTYKNIDEWEPIATRTLQDVKWTWDL